MDPQQSYTPQGQHPRPPSNGPFRYILPKTSNLIPPPMHASEQTTQPQSFYWMTVIQNTDGVRWMGGAKKADGRYLKPPPIVKINKASAWTQDDPSFVVRAILMSHDGRQVEAQFWDGTMTPGVDPNNAENWENGSIYAPNSVFPSIHGQHTQPVKEWFDLAFEPCRLAVFNGLAIRPDGRHRFKFELLALSNGRDLGAVLAECVSDVFTVWRRKDPARRTTTPRTELDEYLIQQGCSYPKSQRRRGEGNQESDDIQTSDM
jgi:hypothetical protein